jgi:hypothetical protein
MYRSHVLLKQSQHHHAFKHTKQSIPFHCITVPHHAATFYTSSRARHQLHTSSSVAASASLLSSSTPKWLLFSDLHFSDKHYKQSKETSSWIVQLVQQHRDTIKHIFILGDLLTNRSTSSIPVLSLCYRFLSTLSNIIPSVHVILGNHDLHLKYDRSVSALDGLDINRLKPYVMLYRDISEVRVDDQPILFMPYYENQNEIVEYLQQREKEDFALMSQSIGMGHLSINGAITQRHTLIDADAHMHQVRRSYSMRYKGLTSKSSFSSLSRTFTGHFHHHQTMLQDYYNGDNSTHQGSITYLGTHQYFFAR